MLKRQIKVTFRLTPAEYESLVAKAAIAGLSREAFLRALLEGCQIRPRPPDSYKDLARELAAIGNNINQLAAKANTLGFVDAPQLKKEAERWHKFQADVERTFLRPDKSDMKWQ